MIYIYILSLTLGQVFNVALINSEHGAEQKVSVLSSLSASTQSSFAFSAPKAASHWVSLVLHAVSYAETNASIFESV